MDKLECSVCLEPYDQDMHIPHILPCSGAHDLCAACIAELRPNGEAFACPQCRDEIPSGVRINENRLLVQVLRQRGHGAIQNAARRAAIKPRRRGGQQAVAPWNPLVLALGLIGLFVAVVAFTTLRSDLSISLVDDRFLGRTLQRACVWDGHFLGYPCVATNKGMAVLGPAEDVAAAMTAAGFGHIPVQPAENWTEGTVSLASPWLLASSEG